MRAVAVLWVALAMALAGPVLGSGEMARVEARLEAPDETGVDLAYLLAIDNPDSGTATVTLAVSNLATDTFEVEESGYHGLYVSVLSLSAADEAGNPLTVEHLPDSGTVYFDQAADVWRVACDGLSALTLEYTVQPGVLGEGESYHRGAVTPEFAVLAGEYAFLVPRGSTADSIHVSFDLPEGWASYAPWAEEGDGYNPAIPEGRAIDSLAVSVFALGQFDVTRETIGTTEVAVAAYAGWPAEVKERLARWSWRILDYQTGVFGVSVGDTYLAIFCPIAPDGYDILGGEWSTSQGYSIRFEADGSFWGKWDTFAHQSFHRWNGWAWGISGLDRWFREGPNVLYEMKTVTELRIERPYGDMVDELRRYTDTYLQDYAGTGNDQPLSGGDLDSFLAYRKAAMVSFLMAKEIYLRTGGAHTFGDFLRVLVETYGHNAELCTDGCLEAELAALTGTDFTQFFGDYVYGVATLPMDWAFEDADGDGLLNALEIGWDTHPERADTDGDGYSDAVEVAKYSDPLDPLSIPRPLFVPLVSAPGYLPPALLIWIDGEGDDWQAFQPVATDPQGDTTGGLHTDLKAFYGEMGPNYAYAMVEVYDPPLLSTQATLEVNWDVEGADGGVWELHTNITSGGSFYSWVDSDGDGHLEEYPIAGAVVAWGNVMELRLPLAELGDPYKARPVFVNLWCDLGGGWGWVDMINP